MNLKQFREKFGIKRIDFSKIRKTDLEEQYESDRLRCPYCETVIELYTEDYDDVLKGTSIQCPECEKWFYATGEVSIETTCTPMEDGTSGPTRMSEIWLI